MTTVYDRIAGGLLDDDPAAHALWWGAVKDEDDRDMDDITDHPMHWLAITIARGMPRFGADRRARIVDAAHDWLSGVADGPLIPLGREPGKWLYLLDHHGLEHVDDADLRVDAGFGRCVYLDTGVVTFLPWRTPGALLADVHEAHQRALAHRVAGRGSMAMHISMAELAELDLAPALAPADPYPTYRPLAVA